MMPETEISYFARTNFHARNIPFGIKQADRLSHMYVIGKTGVGKSTLLETLALQDLAVGRGFALIDPHGDLAKRIASCAEKAGKAITYLNAPDPSQPYGYNPLRRVRADKVPLAVSGILETLKKLWPDAWGVRMEHVLRNSLYALLERYGSTLPDILALYSDDDFRRSVVRDIKNETVKRFGNRNSSSTRPGCARKPWRRSRTSSEHFSPIPRSTGSWSRPKSTCAFAG